MQRQDAVSAAREIFEMEEELKSMKQKFTQALTEAGITEFFSVDWRKLKDAAEGYDHKARRITQ